MEVSADVYLNSTTLLVAVGTLVAYALYRSTKRPSGFPPGPTALPLVGNIPQFYFAKSTLQVFKDLWQKYGAVYSLKFASTNIVVLNTIDVVKEAFIKKATVFAGRPESYSIGLFTDGFKDIAFSTYGPQWRYQRKLGHTAIRHFAQKEQLEKLVFDTIPQISKYLDDLGDKPFAPKWIMGQIVFTVIANLCFGKQYQFNEPELMKWIDAYTNVIQCLIDGLPADYIPLFRYIPTPKETKFKKFLKIFHDKFYHEFNKHRHSFDPECINDFLDSLLRTQKENIEAGEEGADRLTDTHLVQTVVDTVVAATETTTVSLHWAVALMAEHPSIQEKIAMEIDEVVGRDRMPSLDDMGSLPFTEATILEILRYGSVIPFGVPHRVMADTTLGGYNIPKGTTVLINLFALHYDRSQWVEPEIFQPKRFLDSNGRLASQLPNSFLPFSCGRRVCLGKDFAQKEIFLLFTWLLSRYTIYKVPGKEGESLLTVKESAAFAHQPYDEIEVCVKRRF
ncbi:steroid 17-alpha-hydroxylase/17,20 lyase-like isoform X2 [Acanthaster planci]|uniref:Steroid 17-alpha-hydroxylase/17,20 lyase-like isoform X2 n=1 Tax=Acanthaster planci TaxID=133434 RepID=A0A8B7XSV7_ACAPL|nr:steroid 17-alpha-hydroxylase/17,20 lyase-like isoform X2 [Acanthaster planci]